MLRKKIMRIIQNIVHKILNICELFAKNSDEFV